MKPKEKRLREGRHPRTKSGRATVKRPQIAHDEALLGPIRLLPTPPEVEKV
jgi:hypothetical protein